MDHLRMPDTHISIFYCIYFVKQTQMSCTNTFCHCAARASSFSSLPDRRVFPCWKKNQNRSLRCLHSFFISTDTSFFRFFHHIAVVSVTVCFSLRLWQTHQWRFSTAKLQSFPLQRQSDSDLIFQVSRVFRFSMLEWTMSHTSIWGIKHVPQA